MDRYFVAGLFFVYVGLFGQNHLHAQGNQQNWNITIDWPPNSSIDIPHFGPGDNFLPWASALVEVQRDGRERLLEVDSGTVNGGGFWSGEWTRSDYKPGLQGNWPVARTLLGRLYRPFVIDGTSNVFQN